METKAKPELKPLHVGEQFKMLQVTAVAGAFMPEHYCTSEAIVSVSEGSATIEMKDGNTELAAGSSFLIPAGKPHSLRIGHTFKATVVMERNATLEF
ncbi:MAG: cupin domain-containing protein [Flavobacteriales bacterium]|nr:cupin domain-containing protein [Flavobacteriales bacterium]HQZ94604.1 cupin domain-containing protein [Flavobacteriales bacterium]